ncbi:U-box domain-containing protein 9 [Musa troglodytarum]|uniref:U-box domain-containing protein 9 n=1 Tax=Musa troglodytarum TaxID=320322 RepID=A0A9E7K8Z8_9LILI|nr:U-box domain-containing protein 9 [Musa troglodytarum]
MLAERKGAKTPKGRSWPCSIWHEKRGRCMSHEPTLMASPSGDNILEHLQMSWVLHSDLAKSQATEVLGHNHMWPQASGELKKELRRLARAIVEVEDGRVATFEEAARARAALQDLLSYKGGDSNGTHGKAERKIESAVVPEHFLRPISTEPTRDPVILASGQFRGENGIAIANRCLHR